MQKLNLSDLESLAQIKKQLIEIRDSVAFMNEGQILTDTHCIISNSIKEINKVEESQK